MRSARATTLAIVVTLTAVAVSGGLVGDDMADARPPAPPSAGASRTALAKLTLAPRRSLAGYSRARYGSGWASAGEGCDTRDRVLQRDGRNVHTAGGCRITGTWTSLYDGVVVTVGRELDIADPARHPPWNCWSTKVASRAGAARDRRRAQRNTGSERHLHEQQTPAPPGAHGGRAVHRDGSPGGVCLVLWFTSA